MSTPEQGGSSLVVLGNVLTRARTKLRVLALTCRADLFGRLGGTTLSFET